MYTELNTFISLNASVAHDPKGHSFEQFESKATNTVDRTNSRVVKASTLLRS